MKLLQFSNYIFIHWIFICRGEVLKAWSSESGRICWKYSAIVTTYQCPQNTYHYRIYTSWIVSKQEPDNNTATVVVGYRVVVTTGTLQHVDTPEQLIPQWSDHVDNSTSNQQDWLSKLHNILWNVDVSQRILELEIYDKTGKLNLGYQKILIIKILINWPNYRNCHIKTSVLR